MSVTRAVVVKLGEHHAWEKVTALPAATRTSKAIRALYSTADRGWLASALHREPTADEIAAYHEGFSAALDVAFDDAAKRES